MMEVTQPGLINSRDDTRRASSALLGVTFNLASHAGDLRRGDSQPTHTADRSRAAIPDLVTLYIYVNETFAENHSFAVLAFVF